MASAPDTAGRAEPPVLIPVDGEMFVVTAQPDRPGHHHYMRDPGPNPGYGISSASSEDGRPPWSTARRQSGNSLSVVDAESGTSNGTHTHLSAATRAVKRG